MDSEVPMSVSSPFDDWVGGIPGSREDEFKSLLQDLMTEVDVLGFSEESVYSLDHVNQVELQHFPEKEGEVEMKCQDGFTIGYIYLNLVLHSDQIYSYLMDSNMQYSSSALDLTQLIVETENKVGLEIVKSYILHNIIENDKGKIDKTVHILLQRNIQQQIPDARGFYPIHYACIRIKTEILQCSELLNVLRSLIDHGVDTDVPNKSGKTPLHFLARGGDGEVSEAIGILLQAGANPNTPDSQDNLPIHYACGAKVDGMTSNITPRQVKIIQQLVQAGSKVNTKSKPEGRTPLHCCISSNGQVSQAVEYLLQNKADPNIPDVDNYCPIHRVCKKWTGANKQQISHSCSYPFNSFTESDEENYSSFEDFREDRLLRDANNHSCNEDTMILALLLKYGADANLVGGHSQRTPIHYIARSEKPKRKVAEILLKHKANVNVLDCHGLSSIHYICQGRNWNEAVFDLFLKRGADLNIETSRTKETPLHFACHSTPNLQVMEKLLNGGANPNVPNRWGEYPIHLACGLCSRGNLKMLHNQDILNTGEFHLSPIEQSRVEALALLINKGADVNIPSCYKAAPLHLVLLGSGNIGSATKLLLENKADPNLCDGKGRYPIHLACNYISASEISEENCPERLVNLLIQNETTVNTVNKEQQTALHLAVKHKLPSKIVEMLLKAQAEVNVADVMGLHPIHYLFDLESSEQQVNQYNNPSSQVGERRIVAPSPVSQFDPLYHLPHIHHSLGNYVMLQEKLISGDSMQLQTLRKAQVQSLSMQTHFDPEPKKKKVPTATLR